MKKTFVEPALRRYDLQMKEDIVASWRPDGGEAGYHFHFIQYAPGTHTQISEMEGCYDLLINYYATAGHMMSRDAFINWYTGINIVQRGQNGDENNGYEPYGDYINRCEYN